MVPTIIAFERDTPELGRRRSSNGRFRNVKVTSLGLLVGLAIALATTRLIANLLFVSPTDPRTFAVISAMLAAVALAASFLPARRATRVDPLVALRHEC